MFLGVILIIMTMYLFFIILYTKIVFKALTFDLFNKKSNKSNVINFKKEEFKNNPSIRNMLKYFCFLLKILNKNENIKYNEIILWKIKYNLKSK